MRKRSANKFGLIAERLDRLEATTTHIATVSDQNKTLIEQNTELLTQVHALVTALSRHPPKTLIRKPAKETGTGSTPGSKDTNQGGDPR